MTSGFNIMLPDQRASLEDLIASEPSAGTIFGFGDPVVFDKPTHDPITGAPTTRKASAIYCAGKALPRSEALLPDPRFVEQDARREARMRARISTAEPFERGDQR